MRGEFVIAALRLRACLMPQPERPLELLGKLG
jgi:hypothetical protein